MTRKITYGRLEEVLCSLGFTVRVVKDRARIYEHKPTGASIILPDMPPGATVQPRHQTEVEGTLKDFEIAEPLDLAMKLSQAT